MVLLRYLWAVICAVFITTGAASGEGVFKAVGDQVSFRPDNFVPPVTSIIWKQINTSTVKAIEWDEGETLIPNPRFKGITTVDNKTGQITIKNLKVEHSGVYTIDINSKEQQQRFTLTVEEPVPKDPVIEVEEIKDNPDVVYLACKYSETIIWKNSAGEKPEISKLHPKGESITVKKNEGNPDNVYTCTLKNRVSEATSGPVNKKDLFKDETNNALWGLIAIPLFLILALCAFCGVYKTKPTFRDDVNKQYGKTPCIGAMLGLLNGKKGNGDTENPEETEEINKQEVRSDDNGAQLTGFKANSDKVGEQPDTPAGTADSNDNGVEGDVNSDMEVQKKEEEISEAKAAA